MFNFWSVSMPIIHAGPGVTMLLDAGLQVYLLSLLFRERRHNSAYGVRTINSARDRGVKNVIRECNFALGRKDL